MTSTPPPLPHSPFRLTPWRSTPSWIGPAPRPSPLYGRTGEAGRINWSAILASASVSFALVVSVLAWIVTHPHKVAVPPHVPSVAAFAAPAALPQQGADAPRSPTAPQVRVFSAAPAFHRSRSREAISANVSLVEEGPPPLPPPAFLRPKQPERPSAPPQLSEAVPPPQPQPAGQTYGTQVLFLNNPEAAADMAKKEHKLLFVMHISGNFEDSCFT